MYEWVVGVICVDSNVSSIDRVTGCAAKSLANVETWTTVDACFEPAAAVFAVAADEAATVFVDVETLDIAITQELTVLRRAVARHGYPALKLQFWCHPGDTPHRREINQK